MAHCVPCFVQGQRVTEWVADAIGLPQYIPVFKDNLITVSMLPQGPAGRSAMISISVREAEELFQLAASL